MTLPFDKIIVRCEGKGYLATKRGDDTWRISAINSDDEPGATISTVSPTDNFECWHVDDNTGRRVATSVDLLSAIEMAIKGERETEKLNRTALYAVDAYETIARRNRADDWLTFVDQAYKDQGEIRNEVIECAESVGLVNYSERLVDELFTSLVDVHIRARITQWHQDVHEEKPY